jgi:hypothetical protein
MATRKQIEANKVNAKKSTGPKSQAGKHRSRLNSRKHGLTATLLVIGDEDPAEFEALRDELMAQYDPQTPSGCELVEYLASLFWRLRRVPFYEAAVFAARRAQVAEESAEGDGRSARVQLAGDQGDNEDEMSDAEWMICVGRTLIKDGVWNDTLGKLARHEASLLNSLRKTLAMLEVVADAQLNTPANVNLTALHAAA